MDCLDYHSDDSDVIEDVSEDGSIPVQGQLDRSPAAKVLADIAYIAQLVEMENRYMDEELRAAKVSAVDPPKQVADHCKDQSDSDETSESEVSESMDAVEDLESLCEEDEHDEEVPSAGPPRTKNELLRESPETIDQEVLPSDEEIIPVGKVLYCISNEGVLVVQSDATSQPLNENSILCTKSRLVVGRVSEVFGPITAPYYVIRSQFLLSKSDESIGIKAESVRGSDLDSNTATKQLAQFDSETLSPGIINTSIQLLFKNELI